MTLNVKITEITSTIIQASGSCHLREEANEGFNIEEAKECNAYRECCTYQCSPWELSSAECT